MATNEAQLKITAVDQTRAAFESVKRGLEGINKAAELVGKGLALGFLGHEVSEFVTSVVEAGVKFERSQNLMQATLRATGYAAGLTTKELEDMKEELEKKTVFDGPDISKAETALLRYRTLQGDTFKEGLKLSADLAAATGTDLASAAQTLGRAAQGSTRDLRALSEVMPRLSQRQLDHIRNLQEEGRNAEATALIFDELKKSIGGLAEAENTGLLKSTQDMAKAWDHLKETLAESPAINKTVATSLGLISDAINQIDEDIKRTFGGDAATGPGRFAEQLKRLKGVRPDDIVEAVDPVQLAKQRAENQKRIDGVAAKAREDAINAAYLKEVQALKNNQALKRAAAQEDQADQAQFTQQATAVLEDAYRQGLINTTDYWDALLEIDINGHRRRIAGLKEERAAANALLASEATKPEERPALRAQIAKTQRDISREQNALDNASIDSDRKRKTEAIQFLDALNEINAQLAEEAGNLVEAERLRQIARDRAVRAQVAAGHPGDLGTVTELERSQLRQKGLAEATRDTSIAQQELANRERDIQSLVASGAITEQEALSKTDAARREAVKTLSAYADEQERLAKSPEEKQAVRNLRSEIGSLAASADEATKQMRTMLEDSLNQPLIDFVNHSKSAKDAINDLFKNIEQGLLRMSTQNLGERLFGALGGGGTTGGATSGGLAAGAGSWLASLFSGGGGAAAGSATATTSAVVGGNVVTLFGAGGIMTPRGSIPLHRYASGGIASGAQLALFGENRQHEAYVPLPDGRRIPVAMKGGAGVTQHLTINIATPDAQSFKRSDSQVLTSLAMASRRALARR